MRISLDVNIQERYSRAALIWPLSEDLKGYFRDTGFDPKYSAGFGKTRIYLRDTRFNCSSGRGMVFAKILPRDSILGKKTVFGREITEVQEAELS